MLAFRLAVLSGIRDLWGPSTLYKSFRRGDAHPNAGMTL